MATIKTTPSMLRVLRALKAKKNQTRVKIAEAEFNGNSVNFKPILDPLLKAKYITPKEVDVDGVKEEVFNITKSGEAILKKAPADLSRGAGQHTALPKVGGTIEKEYKGKKITVKVVEGGFAYKGKTYPSLTAAAKAVRGTPQEVNGWLFFGLVKPKAE